MANSHVTEQERAAFEAWAESDASHHWLHEDLQRHDEGYARLNVDIAWSAWQAARAAAPVSGPSDGDKVLDYLSDILDAKEVMLAAGIKQNDFPSMFKEFAALKSAAPVSGQGATYIKDADQQGGLYSAVLKAMYKGFQRGDSVERVHAAVMGVFDSRPRSEDSRLEFQYNADDPNQRPPIEYQYTDGTDWCELGPAERMRADLKGVYRLKAGLFPVWSGSEDSRAKPVAWLRFWSACRAPDDCEDGLECAKKATRA